ncbi:unnamed protein product [Dicrocoelium dendriticum]|nr:unnamed protein product [Dicrocoelium dendriticum]
MNRSTGLPPTDGFTAASSYCTSGKVVLSHFISVVLAHGIFQDLEDCDLLSSTPATELELTVTARRRCPSYHYCSVQPCSSVAFSAVDTVFYTFQPKEICEVVRPRSLFLTNLRVPYLPGQ